MPEIHDYRKLPADPGCYLFKDSEGAVLYVGKAKDLKKRVASYFTKNDHDPKTGILVKKIRVIDYYVTSNEVEALLLENNLIKKHYPRYNIDLKDSRRYAYLHLSDEEFPVLEIARDRSKRGRYFGPFVSGRYRVEVQKMLGRKFGILTGKPSNLKRRTLNREEYKERVKVAVRILNGDVSKITREMKKEMESASGKTHFEHAMNLRNQIEALTYLKERQNVELRRSYDADIMNFVRSGEKVYLVLFNVYKGILENKQEFEFDFRDAFLEEFLLQYYSGNEMPKELILPVEVDNAMVDYLKILAPKSFEVIVPERGVKKGLLDLAYKNVRSAIHGESEKVLALQKSLELKSEPRLIECFDISHLRGELTVASMVTFRKGMPYKSKYRRFRIRSVDGGDDYGAMREVIYRRYAKSLKETLPMPDLIVIDGGAGQLSSALTVLKKIGLDIPVISLAKKLEEIYVPNQKNTIRLNEKDPALLLLRAIRDEAHRFAISYNRFLRKKKIRS